MIIQEFMMRSTLSWRPSLFTQKTARELLFDGFSDPLLTAGAFFNPVLYISIVATCNIFNWSKFDASRLFQLLFIACKQNAQFFLKKI